MFTLQNQNPSEDENGEKNPSPREHSNAPHKGEGFPWSIEQWEKSMVDNINIVNSTIPDGNPSPLQPLFREDIGYKKIMKNCI